RSVSTTRIHPVETSEPLGDPGGGVGELVDGGEERPPVLPVRLPVRPLRLQLLRQQTVAPLQRLRHLPPHARRPRPCRWRRRRRVRVLRPDSGAERRLAVLLRRRVLVRRRLLGALRRRIGALALGLGGGRRHVHSRCAAAKKRAIHMSTWQVASKFAIECSGGPYLGWA
uniref:Uncharacterized protein n=1 Tax=Triticum urartu TaxID=4572 RepID=A0A8R7PYQ2_TRIUA